MPPRRRRNQQHSAGGSSAVGPANHRDASSSQRQSSGLHRPAADFETRGEFLWYGLEQLTQLPSDCDPSCPICLEPFNGAAAFNNVDQRFLRPRSCGHVFHTACLCTWLAEPHKRTCPFCRHEFFTHVEDLALMNRVQSVEDDLEILQEEYSELQDDYVNLQGANFELQDENSDLHDQISNLHNKISNFSARSSRVTQEQLTTTRARLDSANAQIATLSKERDSHRGHLRWLATYFGSAGIPGPYNTFGLGQTPEQTSEYFRQGRHHAWPSVQLQCNSQQEMDLQLQPNPQQDEEHFANLRKNFVLSLVADDQNLKSSDDGRRQMSPEPTPTPRWTMFPENRPNYSAPPLSFSNDPPDDPLDPEGDVIMGDGWFD
ncbi:hypothetical protein CC80DRAFT_554874 [Byssothecium circinans]|uniref:RING-type domain-containing protein n=1 Tax=Byssothecium circinans TaxID=147558 RepID=A0A6A5TAK1_9PLEO|nr:hypothetical protein CC80DRAFT_554874 [Byssothecium circinans]